MSIAVDLGIEFLHNSKICIGCPAIPSGVIELKYCPISAILKKNNLGYFL